MAKLSDGLRVKYEPIYPQAPVDMKFHYYEMNEDGEQILKIHEENFKLIQDISELEEFVKKCEGRIIAFDTETTGLSYGKDHIVGFSASLDSYSGIYVPIRHQLRTSIKTKMDKLDENGNQILTKTGKVSTTTVVTYEYHDCPGNVNAKQALDLMYKMLTTCKLALMHNSEFDLNMIKFEGYDITKIRSFDTLILPYLYDPEAVDLAGLKALEKRVLGRTVPEFKDVLGKDAENFAFVKPIDGYLYACYDKETEVLTEDGWTKWEQYDGRSKLATINTENGLLEYQLPSKLYKYVYNGKMECCKSQSVDYCVTPNHNMVVAKAQNPQKGWLFKKAEDLGAEETALTAPFAFKKVHTKVLINNSCYDAKQIARLIALVLADGFCKNRKEGKDYTIGISTSVEKNYEELVKVIQESGFKWRSYKSTNSKKVINWECSNKEIWGWLHPYAGNGAREKRVPKEIFNFPEDAIKEFLRIYSLTDGHNYPSGAIQYYTTSVGMVDDIQRLLMITGKRSSVYKKNPKTCKIDGRIVDQINCVPVYTIKTTSDKTTRYKKGNRFRINYNDYVYCAEVPNHTLITRRNGSTLVAGNCYDTAGTMGVYQKMFPEVQKLLSEFKHPLVFDGVPYKVLVKDNQLVNAFVDYYGHAKILIDKEKAKKYQEQLSEQQRKVVQQIYEYFDMGAFNLSSNALEFQAAMKKKDVYTRIVTDKGAPSWSSKATAEMRRNLNKIKEGLQNWKSVEFTDGKLNKKGLIAFNLAASLELYGTKYFKMKSTLNFLEVKGKKGEKIDFKMFWLTVKQIYKEEMEKVKILELIHTNNSLCKALNSYVDKLTQVDECYMKYRLKGTKSGRLSSGNGSKSDKKRNTYYIDLNAQNLTKPASAYYKAEKCPMDDPESILGWKFTPLNTDYAMEHLEDLYIVEGQDPGITIRGCLKAPEGRYVVSLDYDAEEYRLMAVLSRDSLMLSNFYNGIDPHTASAYAIWGEENYNKAKRKKAKIFNFLNNYSGGAYTLSQALDIPQSEAQEMIDAYNAKFHEMVAWKEKEIYEMYQHGGVVFTAFGRPRQFKGWLNAIEANRNSYETLLEKDQVEKASLRVKSAIERRVASHLIQGTAGDILRLVLLNLYKRYFRNRDPHIDFLSTVHDEVNYTIDKEYTVDYVRELEEIMTFDKLDKTLPIQTSTDIGFTYGNMFPFVWEDEATKEVLIPKRVHHA